MFVETLNGLDSIRFEVTCTVSDLRKFICGFETTFLYSATNELTSTWEVLFVFSLSVTGPIGVIGVVISFSLFYRDLLCRPDLVWACESVVRFSVLGEYTVAVLSKSEVSCAPIYLFKALCKAWLLLPSRSRDSSSSWGVSSLIWFFSKELNATSPAIVETDLSLI